MPTYPLVKFVDSPAVGAVVRLDLNTAPLRVTAEFDPGSPSLEGTRYGPRQLGVPLRLEGTKAVTQPVLSSLARELARRENWLLFQASAGSDPVWFRTSQATPGEQSFDLVRADDVTKDFWDIGLTLDAEGAAYGTQVVLGAVTINNNPAHATNPQSYTLPTILGDAPAPLNVEASFTGTVTNGAGSTLLLSRHSNAGAALNGRIVSGFEGWATGMDVETTLQTNDPLMSGSGSNYLRTAFTVSESYVTVRANKTLTAVPFGRYRMLARFRKTSAAAVFNVQLKQNPGSVTDAGQVQHPLTRYAASSTVGPHWLDMGYASFPVSGSPSPGSTTAQCYFTIHAGRVSGTGSLDFDCLLLVPVVAEDVPASDTIETYHGYETNAAAHVVGWNADDEEVYNSAVGVLGASGPPRSAGRFLTVCPGWNNHLTFMRHVGLAPLYVGAATPDDKLTDTTSLTFSYFPRFLLLGSA